MNEYQLLAKSVDYQLGKVFSVSELDQIQISINESTGLIEQAEVHGVAPFFYQFVKGNNLQVSEQFKYQLQSLTLRHKLAAQARSRVLVEVVDEFSAQEIDLVLLKGIALAHTIYDQAMNRPMRDMYILIRQSDIARAKTVLEELGFVFDQTYLSIYMAISMTVLLS